MIIGGAPITQEFADEIGADEYAPDASSVAHLCRGLLQLRNRAAGGREKKKLVSITGRLKQRKDSPDPDS